MIVKAAPGVSSYGLIVFQFAGADLWTGEIHKHCDGLTKLCCCCACAFYVDGFFFVCAMRHIDAHTVCARGDQLFNHFRFAGSWAKSD